MTHIANKTFELQSETAVTLGNFDGLHLGHQKLIETVKQEAIAQGLQSVVFSFWPHPLTVLKKEPILTILSSDEKRFLLNKMDIDMFIEYPFDEAFAQIDPEFFIRDIICRRLKCKVLVVGEDYRFGKKQRGNTALLEELGRELGFTVKIIPQMALDDIKISSTHIRRLIIEKDFQKIEEFMGRHYFVMGPVEHGKKIGRTLGFPTINVKAPDSKIFPSNGVYCTKTHVKGGIFCGVTNIGNNPTVGHNIMTVETFLFDFEQEIYGEVVQVDFYKWNRDEVKFQDIEHLKKQIFEDEQEGRQYFGL